MISLSASVYIYRNSLQLEIGFSAKIVFTTWFVLFCFNDSSSPAAWTPQVSVNHHDHDPCHKFILFIILLCLRNVWHWLCYFVHSLTPLLSVLSSEKKLEEDRERERKEQEERGTVFYPRVKKVYIFLLCSQLKLYKSSDVLNMIQPQALEQSSLIFRTTIRFRGP